MQNCSLMMTSISATETVNCGSWDAKGDKVVSICSSNKHNDQEKSAFTLKLKKMSSPEEADCDT